MVTKDFLMIEPEGGSGNKEVSVTALSNSEQTERTKSISITGKGIVKVVTVTQKSNDKSIELSFVGTIFNQERQVNVDSQINGKILIYKFSWPVSELNLNNDLHINFINIKNILPSDIIIDDLI